VPQPEWIDINGAWWSGFYRGWRDRDEGHDPLVDTSDKTPWTVGYEAGWTLIEHDRAPLSRCRARARW